jgi:hypothetical protein
LASWWPAVHEICHRHLIENHGWSLHPASAAPGALLEVEHLGFRAEPEPQQKFWRQQRNVMTGGTIDLDEIAPPKILAKNI